MFCGTISPERKFIMKVLRISHLCLVGALILGLMVTWSAASPQPISGERLEGGGCCNTTNDTNCGNAEGEICDDTYLKCNSTGDGNCSTATFPHSCLVDSKCLNEKNQNCN